MLVNCSSVGLRLPLRGTAVESDRRRLAFSACPLAQDRLHISDQNLKASRCQPVPHLPVHHLPGRKIARNPAPRTNLPSPHSELRCRPPAGRAPDGCFPHGTTAGTVKQKTTPHPSHRSDNPIHQSRDYTPRNLGKYLQDPLDDLTREWQYGFRRGNVTSHPLRLSFSP